mmetsp:Transcript_11664/g.25727  ORF Transcript_11664/g.25727 Transcript_11664/m.25727 type:complete len:255 (-) Transcript_11664:312-1076(-)
MVLFHIHQESKQHLHILLNAIMTLHHPLQLLFHTLASIFGTFKDLLVVGWDRFSLEECHDIVGCSVSHCQIQGGVGIVVLLTSRIRIGMVQCLNYFNRSVVMSSVVKGKIAVVVFLSSSLGEDLEKKFHAVERTLFPGGKVKSKVAVVVGHGCCFGVGFKKSLNNLTRSPKTSSTMQRQVPTIILPPGFMPRRRITRPRQSCLPSLRKLMQIDIFGISSHGSTCGSDRRRVDAPTAARTAGFLNGHVFVTDTLR